MAFTISTTTKHGANEYRRHDTPLAMSYHVAVDASQYDHATEVSPTLLVSAKPTMHAVCTTINTQLAVATVAI